MYKFLPHLLFVGAVTSVAALDNGFLRPPLGWSALYGAPFGAVNETIVIEAAKGLRDGGFLNAGYEYVTLDDWFAERDQNGKIIGSPKTFPSGMASVGRAIHEAGAKFGVYSAASQRTCGNFSASQFNEVNDANTFAHEWQIDFLKYDSCLYNNGVASRPRYTAMSRALNATGRKIFYSVEGWSPGKGSWGPELANMWRTGNDIWPKWDKCILHNLYSNNIAAGFQRPGAFNDPDMIQPPAYIPGSASTPGLTGNESQSQFVLWAVMKAPLVLGAHWSTLATMKTDFPEYYNLVTSKHILQINQDLSPQAKLHCQMPSKAQQTPGTRFNITLQECNPQRCDQKFVRGANGQIKSQYGDVCVVETAESAPNPSQGLIVGAVACGNRNDGTAWSLAQDSQFHTAVSGSSGRCLAASYGDKMPRSSNCLNNGTLPPPLSSNVGQQLFVWDALEGSVVAGGTGMCMTLGNPNYEGGSDYDVHSQIEPKPQWQGNANTLEHEVWRGPLSSGFTLSGSQMEQKEVVVLFNKGANAETISAATISCTAGNVAVTDVLDQGRRLADVADGEALTAMVPAHGVRLFLLGCSKTFNI